MKILLLIDISAGGGRYGLMLAKALDKIANVKLIIPDRLMDPFVEEWIRDLDYLVYKHPRNNSFLGTIKRIISIRKSIKSFAPDIVHDTAGSGTVLNMLFLSLFPTYKFIVTEHEPVYRRTDKLNLKKRIYSSIINKYADSIIVHGPYCLKMMINIGIDKDRLTIIPHGVYDYYRDLSCDKVKREEETILFFGVLRPDKGIDNLLEIADKVATVKPNVQFLVAGKPATGGKLKDTKWPKKLDTYLGKMKGSSSFEVHDGFIPDKEVANYFRRAKYVVLPYKSAAQSGVITIALAFGCCVVAFDVGDLGYMIKNKETGIVVPSNEVEKFSEALINLLENPDQSKQIGKAAYEYADKELNWNVIAKKHQNLYQLKLDKAENENNSQ